LLALLTVGLGFGLLDAGAKPASNRINIIPTITSITFQNGQLLASGNVTALIKGQTFTKTFSGVPVNISLSPNQIGATDCPILDLQLGPITLDLLGLVVETSPICLEITAHQGGGLLGDLLCSVANLLQAGVPLNEILAALSVADLQSLINGLSGLLNGALGNLYQAILTAISLVDAQHTCAILHLELGPLDLTLLGLEVVLDNCANGPVVVDITGQTGKGRLLGNLLCELLNGGLINVGSTLQGILNQLLALF
jgi:hypothetical protein